MSRGTVDVTPRRREPLLLRASQRDRVLQQVKENIIFLKVQELVKEQQRARCCCCRGHRNSQDPDGRGGGRRDRPPVRVRRPRRLHQHVHGHQRAEGRRAIPQADESHTIRRRDRISTRRGFAGQYSQLHEAAWFFFFLCSLLGSVGLADTATPTAATNGAASEPQPPLICRRRCCRTVTMAAP